MDTESNIIQIDRMKRPVINTETMREVFDVRSRSAGLVCDCPPDGNFTARMAVVAEAPGGKEVAAKSPLVGGSGNFLWSILRGFGYTRNDFYITNVCKRQVAFDKDEKKSPINGHELEQWKHLLLWELDQLPNLEVVVAMGSLALEALCEQEGITEWAGSVTTLVLPSGRTVNVLLTYNSAYVMRYRTYELIFKLHLQRLKAVLEGRWIVPTTSCLINPTAQEALSYLDHLKSQNKDISYDIETVGTELSCVGLSNSKTEAMCIAFRSQKENVYSTDEEIRIRRKIADVLGNTNPPGGQTYGLVAQNNAFDSSWLWYKDKIRVAPLKHDTMLAHHCLFPWMPHDLGFLTTQYTMFPYYKNEKYAWKEGGDIDRFWRYNCMDCIVLQHITPRQIKELEAAGLYDFFTNHIMRLNPHLVRMTVGGVKLDLSLREKINEHLRVELGAKEEQFYTLVQQVTGLGNDYRPNPNSSQQLADLLFTRLKLIGRGVSTDHENRERMRKHPRTSADARLILGALDQYKEDAKFFGTYVNTGIDPDGRFRAQFKQTGTTKAPGRLSSASVGWGHYEDGRKIRYHGGNLQNQPPRAHEMFIADDGYVFIYFDLAQAEARYVGWDANIPTWKEQFERARLEGGYDAHRALAADLFRIPYDETPPGDRILDATGKEVYSIRYKAKRCRHGLNYRMEAPRLASTAGLSIPEALFCYERYHRITPQLKVWWAALEQEVRTKRVLYNAFGRRLFVQGDLSDPKTMESIVAFKPQSTIGDKTCQVIYQAEDHPMWDNSCMRMAMQIHDACIALVRADKAMLGLSIMKHYAEQPIMVRGEPMIIPADVAVSVPDQFGVHRWSGLQKIKHFEGMNIA